MFCCVIFADLNIICSFSDRENRVIKYIYQRIEWFKWQEAMICLPFINITIILNYIIAILNFNCIFLDDIYYVLINH